jgi:hypothetical protein
VVTPLVDQRRLAVGLKQSVLSTSLESWLKRTAATPAKHDRSFDIHFTQTREVDRLLAGLVTYLTGAIKASADTMLASGRDLESAILASCEVWEFFRSKLAQRLDDQWRPFLRAGDELAWRCYQPVREAAFADGSQCKAPPLVYLNNTWSPFTVRRNREYHVDAVPQAFLRKASFAEALARMPFPVVGVPWYQLEFLPDVVSICHEVGHSVEVDFGLESQIAAAIGQAVGVPRKGIWQARSSELFADYFACLCVGPAYPWALANILLSDAIGIASEADTAYPSIHGRMLFCAEIVRLLKMGDEADAFLDEWNRTYPGIVAADRDEIQAIAAHFHGGGGAHDPAGLSVANPTLKRRIPLREIIAFTPENQMTVRLEAAELDKGGAPATDNIRVLSACASFVQNPGTARATLLEAMKAACIDEKRNKEAALSADEIARRWLLLEESGHAICKDLLTS